MIRKKHKLRGWAISPIHIGDGTKMDPSCFKLDGNNLARFETMQIIANMDENARQQYIKHLNLGGIKQAQEFLRSIAKNFSETIAISSFSKSDVEKSLSDTKRGGDISPFIRSGGKPFIPGTSIKGALRTAWLAKLAGENSNVKDNIKRDLNIAAQNSYGKLPKTSDIANKFQQTMLKYQNTTIEKDPFRDLLVSDGAINNNTTIIDKVQIAKLTKNNNVAFGPEGGIQIHVERLNSIFDATNNAAYISIEIALPEQSVLDKRKQKSPVKSPEDPITFSKLQVANNLHHAKLWFMELDAFYHGTGTDQLMNGLLENLQITATNPQDFATQLTEKGAWLMKIGRYAHFESKTIEGMRFGEKRAIKGKSDASFISDHASSRQLAKNKNNVPLPFGWLILFNEGQVPPNTPKAGQNIVRTFENTSGNKSSTGVKPTSVLSSQFIFIKGDKLTNEDGEIGICQENVSATASEMMIKIDGSNEVENPTNWKKA